MQKISGQNSHPTSKSKNFRKNALPNKSKRLLWKAAVLTSVAVVSASAGALLAVSLSTKPLMQSQLSPEEQAIFGGSGDRISRTGLRLTELTRPVNILVLGVKVLTTDINTPAAQVKKQGYQALVNSFTGLTDTMLLLRFDPTTNKLTALSIPRDTRTEVEGRITKINNANVVGGPALSAKVASELLNDVAIDRYIRINVQGVEKLIDALGGVNVYVPKDMKYQDDSQHLYINLKAGKQHLNGKQALQLLRFRHDESGDIGRIQRQQLVMRSLMEQTVSPATIGRVPQILSVVQSHIDTNLSMEELMALVAYGAQTKRSNVQMLMLPGQFSEAGQYRTSYWLPDEDRISTMMAQHFDVFTPGVSTNTEPANIRVAIANSTGDDSAVRSLVRNLNKAGYQNVQISKSWYEPLDTTHILAQQGDTNSAESIHNVLNLGEVRVESTGNLNSDVTIVIGKDWLLKKAEGAEEAGGAEGEDKR